MSRNRLTYRFSQFRRHLGSRLAASELARARQILTPAQMSLFLAMTPGEQAHSLDVLHRLEAQGEKNPDLLAAALLHDIGKNRRPLRLWERVWIVFVKTLLPQRAQQWGNPPGDFMQLPWWQIPLVVAEQHPAWGAELARTAGCSPLVTSLICRHQEKEVKNLNILENILLSKLQAVDNKS